MKSNSKTIVSLFVFSTLLLAGVNRSFAQAGKFSAGAELGLPMGNFGDAANVGIGASARYEAPIQDKLNWIANLGYLHFGAKGSNSTVSASYGMIPIQGGVKYYFDKSYSGFYAGANLGFTIVSASVSSGVYSGSSSSTYFSFAPGAGYHLSNLDFGASFQIVSNANYFNIRVAYVFGK
ncbi:MAG: hypothetical protein JST74_10015 [Bacteroidetes bacterium]|nr:hypothetical protein [Bacteroidota bacterium]